MQEDVLGTQRAVMPSAVLVTCTRCNRTISRNEARIVASDTLSESRSDFDYLCRDCQLALESGERDVASEV